MNRDVLDAKPPARGRVDWERLRNQTEEEIEALVPEEYRDLPDDFYDNGKLVYYPKEPISLRVDEDVLAWFRAQGPRYQTRMNAILRTYMRHHVKRAESTKAKPKRKTRLKARR